MRTFCCPGSGRYLRDQNYVGGCRGGGRIGSNWWLLARMARLLFKSVFLSLSYIHGYSVSTLISSSLFVAFSLRISIAALFLTFLPQFISFISLLMIHFYPSFSSDLHHRFPHAHALHTSPFSPSFPSKTLIIRPDLSRSSCISVSVSLSLTHRSV